MEPEVDESIVNYGINETREPSELVAEPVVEIAAKPVAPTKSSSSTRRRSDGNEIILTESTPKDADADVEIVQPDVSIAIPIVADQTGSVESKKSMKRKALSVKFGRKSKVYVQSLSYADLSIFLESVLEESIEAVSHSSRVDESWQ